MQLLSNPWSGRWADAQLKVYSWKEPHTEVMYAGREDGDSNFFLVDSECARQLIRNHWVEGLKRIGYTSTDEFRLSEGGTRQLRAWAEQDERDAKALLVPGEHGWSSIFHHVGYLRLRSNDQQGHVFRNPANEHFIVFLHQNSVQKIEQTELYI